MSLKGVTFKESVYKTRLTIGGLRIYIYGVSTLEGYSGKVDVLYMFHGRTNSYESMEACAYYILAQREKFARPLLCVTFDMQNHGERVLDAKKNESWSENNSTHGMDMGTIIDLSVQDAIMVMNYLPSYFQGYTFENFATGISMGGHACYRLAIAAPEKIKGIIPLLGCADLCTLLLNRYAEWKERPSDDPQLIDSFSSLHSHLLLQDRQVKESFPLHIKVFALFGKEDKLVPAEYSTATLSAIKQRGNEVLTYFEAGTGHKTTEPMLEQVIQTLAKWIVV